MELDPQVVQQLLEVFDSELVEQLQVISDGLIKLEKGLQGEQQRSVYEEIFRSAHNIKGSARGIEVLDVSDIAHHMESLFSELKRQNKVPSAEMIDLCLSCVDQINTAFRAYRNKTPLGFDKTALIQHIDKHIAQLVGQSPDTDPAPGSVTEETGVQAAADNASDTTASAETLQQTAEQATAAGSGGEEVIRITIGKLQAVAASSEELQVAKIEMDDHLHRVQDLGAGVETLANQWAHTMPTLRHQLRNLPPELSQLIKNSTDALLELTIKGRQAQNEMRASTSRLGVLSSALQTDLRMMRLVPVASLLRPLSRTVRDIARELDKQVDYRIIGDEIEMDRAVLDSVRDPLIHLLRNAIDHGFETPQARKASGKPETGTLVVKVQAEGSQISMAIEDDGYGIDAKKIAAVARKRHVSSDAELASMSEDEILELIFRPGFSSKEIITNVSGRGVGLDVVRANLRKLKGSVQVHSRIGEGTRFMLNLPLTLATDHGLMVRVGSNDFAIPTTSVDRVLELEPEDIIDVEACQAIILDGKAVPLHSLANVLEMPAQPADQSRQTPVVLISKGWDTVALAVDKILGEREIIIKPLQPPLLSVRNTTGGTLTGSGEIIMVLNPSDLVDSALKSGSASRFLSRPSADEESIAVPRILVVDDSITTRTLEKNILETAGYRVATAVDGRQAWNLLQEEEVELVVTDIEMPDMNGFDLTSRIKQDKQLAHLPVIIVTSLAKDEDQQRGIEVGANAYIVKGEFETKALLDVVRQMV